MKLNRTGSNWNELERNKINENWDIIEGLGGTLNKIVSGVDWKEPVETEADLPKDAEVGETRMVRESVGGVSHVYRYNGSEWELIQEIDATLVNEVDRRLTAQLAEKANEGEVRKKSVPIGLNDADPEMLAAIEGGEGTSFNLLSIPREHSVTPRTTTFIEVSTNLFNKDDVILSSAINTSTGEIISSTGHATSHFIEIEPETDYTSNFVLSYAFYDINKNFISSFAPPTTDAYTYRSPTSAGFMRVVYSAYNNNDKMLNKGTTLLPYEPYFLEFRQELNPLKKEVIKKEHISKNAVGLDQVDFVKLSTNIIDTNNLKSGYTLSGTTGEEVANAVNNVSDFMEIEPNTYYTTAYIARRAFYDNNKVFISSTTGNGSFQTPLDAYFARWVVNNSNLGNAQVNKGDQLLPYEPHYKQLEGVSVKGVEVKDTINSNYFVNKLNSDEVYTAELQTDVSVNSPDNLKELLHTDIYAMYDELVTNYPDYLTKQLLGTEATGRELYRVDGIPPQTGASGVKIPKVYITAGTHGSEKTAVWVMYQTLKALCESWAVNPSLEYLRWNVHLIVVPITNPWGWDFITEASGNRTGTRKNSNGVDIARNYPTGWVKGSDPTSATYSGTSPLSEPEAQYTNSILEAEKDNLIYVCDFHNFFTRNGSIWNAAATNYQINLGEHLVRHMGYKWKKEHDFMPQDESTMVGYSDMGSPNGSIGKHATSFGIHGGTFEVSEYCPWEENGAGSGNSPLAIKFGMDAFVNWLNLVVKNSIIHLQ